MGHKLATKKIAIAPIIANNMLSHETFIQIRERMEQNALQSCDIDRIIYKKDHWLIQGSNAIVLEDYRDLFNIVIWRVSIIPAFAHFADEEEFYDKISMDRTAVDTKGIWCILSKEQFMNMFDDKLLNEIDEINDETYAYITDETLIEKLKVINIWKNEQEIIIMGQKTCVVDVLRIIRQQEVTHSSMISKFESDYKQRFDWEIKCDDERAPDANMILSYSCLVSNLPLNCEMSQIYEMLSKYSRWTFVEEMRCKNYNKEVKIEFDEEKSFRCFVEDIEKGNLRFGGNKLRVQQYEKEIKVRKRRKVVSGNIFV